MFVGVYQHLQTFFFLTFFLNLQKEGKSGIKFGGGKTSKVSLCVGYKVKVGVYKIWSI